MLKASLDEAFASMRAHRFSSLAAVCFAVIAFCGCGAPLDPGAPALRIGTYQWPGSYWIYVAAKKGWFKEAGINVQPVDVNNRYFPALDEVVGGKFDAMGFSQYDLVRRVAAGHDLVGVAALDYSTGAEALVAKRGIRSLRDLKGMRLALYRGTYLEYLLSVIAEREGIDMRDIVLVDRTGAEALSDFKAGRVDAIFFWDPYVSQAVAAGGITLFSSAEIPGLTYTVLSFRGEFVRRHPREIQALLRVWDRAERYVREHPEEACGIVSAQLHETTQSSRDLMRTVRILDLADNARAFSYAAGFESLHGSWRRMNDFMLDNKIVVGRADNTSHLDSEFIRMLE